MTTISSDRVHVIAGGYPPGALGGHDMDYARLRLLELLEEQGLLATTGNDFTDIHRWLPGTQLLITTRTRLCVGGLTTAVTGWVCTAQVAARRRE